MDPTREPRDSLALEYQLVLDDILAYSDVRDPLWIGSAWRRVLAAVSVCAVTVLTLNVVLRLRQQDPEAENIVPIVCVLWVIVLLLLFERPLSRWRLRRSIVRQGLDKQFGEQRVVFDRTGLVLTVPTGELKVPWAEIDGLERVQNFVLIKLQATSSLIIPIRAFTTLLEADEFVRRANELRSTSLGA